MKIRGGRRRAPRALYSTSTLLTYKRAYQSLATSAIHTMQPTFCGLWYGMWFVTCVLSLHEMLPGQDQLLCHSRSMAERINFPITTHAHYP